MKLSAFLLIVATAVTVSLVAVVLLYILGGSVLERQQEQEQPLFLQKSEDRGLDSEATRKRSRRLRQSWPSVNSSPSDGVVIVDTRTLLVPRLDQLPVNIEESTVPLSEQHRVVLQEDDTSSSSSSPWFTISSHPHDKDQFADSTITPISNNNVGIAGRIVGGTPAEEGEYPWFVRVEHNGDFLCGGTLIGPNVVLTSGHCDRRTGSFTVLANVQQHQQSVNSQGNASPSIPRSVVQRLRHPLFDFETFQWDYMLLFLDEPIWSIDPVALNFDPTLPVDDTPDLIVIGMGLIDDVDNPARGVFSDDLLQVKVDQVPLQICTEAYKELSEVVSDNIRDDIMFCAGNEPDKDSCQGDSGGPILDATGSIQLGLVSFGYGCGEEGYPGVYAKVSAIESWLEDEVCFGLGSSIVGAAGSSSSGGALPAALAAFAASLLPDWCPNSKRTDGNDSASASEARVATNTPTQSPTTFLLLPTTTPSSTDTPTTSTPTQSPVAGIQTSTPTMTIEALLNTLPTPTVSPTTLENTLFPAYPTTSEPTVNTDSPSTSEPTTSEALLDTNIPTQSDTTSVGTLTAALGGFPTALPTTTTEPTMELVTTTDAPSSPSVTNSGEDESSNPTASFDERPTAVPTETPLSTEAPIATVDDGEALSSIKVSSRIFVGLFLEASENSEAQAPADYSALTTEQERKDLNTVYNEVSGAAMQQFLSQCDFEFQDGSGAIQEVVLLETNTDLEPNCQLPTVMSPGTDEMILLCYQVRGEFLITLDPSTVDSEDAVAKAEFVVQHPIDSGSFDCNYQQAFPNGPFRILNGGGCLRSASVEETQGVSATENQEKVDSIGEEDTNADNSETGDEDESSGQLQEISSSEVVVEENFCVTGFVMDRFCIQRGTLLDKGWLETLKNPDQHSIHCLVDVGICMDSGYEVLTEPVNDDGEYTRAVVLDDVGNGLVVQTARQVGICDTCDGSGFVEEGFQATFLGTLVVPTGGDDTDTDDIPLLKVRELLPPSDDACGRAASSSALERDEGDSSVSPDTSIAPSVRPTSLPTTFPTVRPTGTEGTIGTPSTIVLTSEQTDSPSTEETLNPSTTSPTDTSNGVTESPTGENTFVSSTSTATNSETAATLAPSTLSPSESTRTPTQAPTDASTTDSGTQSVSPPSQSFVPSQTPSPSSVDGIESPPRLPQVAITRDGFNCEELHPNLQVRWAIDNDNMLEIELAGLIDETTDYMAFGISGEDNRTAMIGADVVVADVFAGSFRAIDYYMSGRSPCIGGQGVCPDILQGFNDDISDVSGEIDSGITLIRYNRPLNPTDTDGQLQGIPVDKSISIQSGEASYIAWAIGRVDELTGFPLFHSIAFPRGNVQIEFGRDVRDSCIPFGSRTEPFSASEGTTLSAFLVFKLLEALTLKIRDDPLNPKFAYKTAGGDQLETANVSSEGQAYGMLVAATVLASWETVGTGRQSDFEQVQEFFYGYFNGWQDMSRNSVAPCQNLEQIWCGTEDDRLACLPSSTHNADLTAELEVGSLAAADEDAILSMIMAVRTFEKSTAKPVWYDTVREWADRSCTAFLLYDTVRRQQRRIVSLGTCLGGWNSAGNNPSYHSPGSYKLMRDYQRAYEGERTYELPDFGDKLTLQERWDVLIETTYDVLLVVRCPLQGMVPNWSTLNLSTDGVISNSGEFFASARSPQFEYGLEAARTMWRVALDAALYPEEQRNFASSFLVPLATRLDTFFDPQGGTFFWEEGAFTSCTADGMLQAITSFSAGWRENAVVYGPTLSALTIPQNFISEEKQQEMVNRAGLSLSINIEDEFFSRSWTILSLLMINGSFDAARGVARALDSSPITPSPAGPTPLPTTNSPSPTEFARTPAPSSTPTTGPLSSTGTPSQLRGLTPLPTVLLLAERNDHNTQRVCDDDISKTFSLGPGRGHRDCYWLRRASPVLRERLCEERGSARGICEETCGKCSDTCEDQDGVPFDIEPPSSSTEVTDCAWLRQRSNLVARNCKTGKPAYTLCLETCNSCLVEPAVPIGISPPKDRPQTKDGTFDLFDRTKRTGSDVIERDSSGVRVQTGNGHRGDLKPIL